MNESKMTPWFPAYVNPVRAGVYKIEGQSCRYSWSHFDGEFWNGAWNDAQEAFWNRRFYAVIGHSGYASKMEKWRGLANKP